MLRNSFYAGMVLGLLLLAPSGLLAGLPGGIEVAEQDIAYEPVEIHGKVGQILRLTNRDPFPHKTRISKLAPDGGIEAIVLAEEDEPQGAVREFRLREAGRYELRCMLHDGMTATLLVE